MIIHILDKFGNKHEHNIDHYVWQIPMMNLYRFDENGVLMEIVGDKELKRAKALLVGVYYDIAGFYVEVENEKTS